MPRTLSGTRTLSSRRYTPRDQKYSFFSPAAPGQIDFGNFEPSGESGKYLSVFIWIKMAQEAPSNRSPISKFNYGTSNRSWGLTSPNGQMKYIVSGDGGVTWKQYQTNDFYNDGLWHPIGFVWNDGVLTVCSDLTYDATVTKLADVAFNTIHQGNALVMMGALTNGVAATNGWIGSLGPCIMSPTALTEEDWLNFVYDGLSPAGLSFEALLREGSGGTAFDTSGNGHNGTFGGNAVWIEDGPFNVRSLSGIRTLTT